MRKQMSTGNKFFLFVILLFVFINSGSQTLKDNPELDRKVENFLSNHKHDFHDMNVPEADGKLLYDLIIKGRYTKALEIGTSTGYSSIFIAWALSKTGGKLITIEINEQRYRTALKNFEKAGLSEYIDARLADAHDLVKELAGPFDFVFSDADKIWYKNYFMELDPKMEIGGCYATHNISDGRRGGFGWNKEYYDYIMGLDNYDSKLQPGSSMLVSYKTDGK